MAARSTRRGTSWTPTACGARGRHPGLDYFAFKVYDDITLTAVDERLRERGNSETQIVNGAHPMIGRRIQVTLPS
jgi:hypothetical protein